MNISFLGQMQQICVDSVNAVNASFLYYTHIPVAIVSLIIGIFVLLKNKDQISRALFSLSLFFSIFIILNLITWLSPNSTTLTFFWSFFGLIIALIFIACFYFSYIFIFGRDLSLKIKLILLVLIAPILIITPSHLDVKYFDGLYCMPIENTYFMYYYYLFGLISSLVILFLLFKRNFRISDKTEKKKNIIFVFGIEIFILMFFFSSFLVSYLYDAGIINSYDLEQYGFIGMVIFMAFLAYLIVRFKAFDIKLIGAQALVWALVIMIGSEFLFVTNLTSQILTGVTLVISSVLGLILVRSVKKEVALREELEIANNNQQSLIHFITHQVKGFFTKSKMVFAGILEGDFGEASETIKGVAQDGLNSDNNAVTMVQDILSASNFRSGTVAYTLAELDLAELVRNITKEFEETACKKNLTCNVDIPAEPIMVMADKTQISQAVKNLIDNSVKYTPQGQMSVSLRRVKEGGQERALFEVSDTGVGLSDSDKQKLFTEGGRGDESLKTNTNSTGYGLFILKKIVENHKGKVWAESAGRGKGSQFYISLPTIVA